MDQAMQGAREAAVVEPSPQPATSLDGNNVDMDQEMSQLTRNKLMYSVQNQLAGAKFRQFTTLLDADR
jgi:flagellar basal-body rod protein FlgB